MVHIHVKDSFASEEAREGYTYVLPGTGEFPMGPLRKALAAEFPGPVSLEWEKLWIPELAPLDDALDAASRNNWW